MTFNVHRFSCWPKTMSRRPCWCTKPVLWEKSFLMFNSFFYPNNLHSLISTYVSEDVPYFKIIRLHICYSFHVLLQFFLLTPLSQALNYSDWAHYLLIYVNTFLCHLVPSRRPDWQDNDLHSALCPLHQTKWIQAATRLGRPEVNMEWRSVTSRYHGSKISGSLQSFLKEKGICVGERWKNSMEYRFVLECSQARESHTFQSFRFSAIFAVKRFVEIKKCCYYGNVT